MTAAEDTNEIANHPTDCASSPNCRKSEVALVREKLDSLQVGRGVAAMMVVLRHVGDFVGQEPGLWRNQQISRWLAPGGYGVDYFFILSGAVILLAHWDDLGIPRQIKSFLWKRFRRIYPIYWVFLVLTVLKQLHVNTGHTLYQRNPLVILSGFVLIHIGSLEVNMNNSWTLFHEVLFYFIFTVSLLNKRLGIVLVICWCCLSFIVVGPTSPVIADANSYPAMLFSPLHCLFGYGLLIGLLLKHGLVPTQRWLQLLGAGIFGATIYFDLTHSGEYIWIRVFGDAGLALAVMIAAGRDRLRGRRIPRFFLFLGDASYSIYLVHFMVISAIAREGFLLDRNWHLPIMVWCISMFVVAVSSGIVAHMVIERPLLKILPKS